MRVLMLGWEFPPFISGGLGTACYGLTRAMNAEGVDVLFVLPKAVDASYATHVKLLAPRLHGTAGKGRPAPRPTPGVAPQVQANGRPVAAEQPPSAESTTYRMDEFDRTVFKTIPSWLTSPYHTPAWLAQHALSEGKTVEQVIAELQGDADALSNLLAQYEPPTDLASPPPEGADDYAGDVLNEVQRYASLAVQLTRGESFDVIHAHDWMTYPAGLAISALSGKPLVVHVHSTEFDRSGENVDSRIYDIERRGMHGAIRVICVSYLTRNIVTHRYGVVPEKVDVVYNGIEMPQRADAPPVAPIHRNEKIVLFLGRITMQKGPEYFVAAAKKVLDKFDDVKFVMAGSGDLVRPIIELAAEMGIGHKILFTGFLRGKDVERVFSMASVYVMPSVSEPFGIAPLEAIRHDVPVIISKNSGVAEVLSHALKVDFWDVDEMANKIIAVLKHPPLGRTLREHADFEVRKLTWETAARECLATYNKALEVTDTPRTPRRPTSVTT